MANNNNRLKRCVIINFILLFIIIIFVSIFKEPNDKYFRIGPNNNLSIMSVKINSIKRYILFSLGKSVV